MFTWIQKYHRALLVFVLFISITGMIWLFNPASDFEAITGGNKNQVATIYGRTIDIDTYQKFLRLFSLARELEMYDYLTTITSARDPRIEFEDAFVFNTLVLREEARKLQLEPSLEEMQKAFQELPRFQTDGKFDRAKVSEFLQDSLASRGFTQSQLDELVKDSLRLQAVRKMITAAVPAPESEARRMFDLGNQRTLIQAVKFNTQDFANEINPTEEEITKHYELNQATYLTPEKRRVEYVTFKTAEAPKPAADETKPAEGAGEGEGADPKKEEPAAADPAKTEADTEAERIAKLDRQQQASDKATEFVMAVAANTQKDTYLKQAEQLGLEVKSTELFETNNFSPELMTLGGQAMRAAQQLTPEVPVSDAVPVKDDFVVMHLAEVVESRQMTLEEAKPKVIEEIKQEQGQKKMEARVEEVRQLLMDGIAEGKSFEDLAKEQNLTVITPPPFRLNEPPQEQPDIRALVQGALYVKAGGVSTREEVEGGVLLVHVKQRESANHDVWETEKESTTDRLHSAMREQFMQNWFTTAREKANLEMLAAAASAAKNS